MNIQYLRKQKELGIYDVVVCGGGLAGVMSAVAAAREGKRVILIEKYSYLGGMATTAIVYPFMRHSTVPNGEVANAGLYFELLKRIYELGGSDGKESRHYRDEYMKIVLDRLTKEYGIKVLFRATLCDVEKEDDRHIKSVTVATSSGLLHIHGKVFIDATGNADLCAYAGLPFYLGRESDQLCQPMTLCFRLGNIDWERFDAVKANQTYKKYHAAGKLINPREDILFFRYPVLQMIHMNTTRVSGKDPTNAEDVTDAEMTLREQMLEMVNFCRKHVEGMENCELIQSGPEAGIRESRRIIGLSCMTVEDLCSARKFEDSIARGTYEIDIHDPVGGGTTHIHVPKNDYYTIPYRALIPKDADNLLVAGRCISATHEALAAVRIMPITTCMGEAAGIAAAMAIENGLACEKIDVETLQKKITSYGGLI